MVKNNYAGRIVRIKDNYVHHPSLRGKYGVVTTEGYYIQEERELEVELLKNYEHPDGEREGTYRINIDFLEFVSSDIQKKGGRMPRLFRWIWYGMLLLLAWDIISHINDIALFIIKTFIMKG